MTGFRRRRATSTVLSGPALRRPIASRASHGLPDFRTPRPAPLRTAGVALLVAGVETWLGYEYHVRGTDWHFVLHTLLGCGAGFAVAALLGSRRVVGWVLLGQALSVLPDVLFITAGIPHQRWMDVFVAHITIHVVAQPLLVAATLFLVAGWGWWLAAWTSQRAAGRLLALAGVAVVGIALALHHPIPTSLAQLDHLEGALRSPGSWCG